MANRIYGERDILEGLTNLANTDSRLIKVMARAGPVPLRLRGSGFEGLAEIIVSQQISKSAARAIWGRLTDQVAPLNPFTLMQASDEALRVCGLSRAKVRTLRGIAQAVQSGFQFDELADLEPKTAIETLTSMPGIGPWTAEVYLLFCLGHKDIFPAGDVALQTAVGHAFALKSRPSEKEVRVFAEKWSPWRGVAARLFWRYYAVTQRDATPFPEGPGGERERTING